MTSVNQSQVKSYFFDKLFRKLCFILILLVMKELILVMKSKGLQLVFVLFSISWLSVTAQGIYLNPAAEADMYKPLTTASSTLSPSSTANFSPDNLLDGSVASWSEGAKGSGVGEYIQVEFRYPDFMRYVMFINGYGVEKHWKANNRIKSFKISNEEGESRIVQLKDTRAMQVVGLLELVKDEYGDLTISEPLYGNSFKFEIMEVYSGTKWQDACITEMDINNWYSELFQMNDDYIYLNLFREYFDGVVDYKGDLFIESDWDGYVQISVEDGRYSEDIVSGDGTTGYEDYQVFSNQEAGSFFMFVSEYVSSVVYLGEDADVEVNEDGWGKSDAFSNEFFVYDIFDHAFNALESDSIVHLFSSSPIEELSKLSGESLNWEDIWIVVTGFDNIVKAKYPATIEDADYVPEAGNDQVGFEVFYWWSGTEFVKKAPGFFEATGGDLGEDEDE